MTAEIEGLHDAKKAEASAILQTALDHGLTEVVVLGITSEGNLYQHATNGDPHRFIYMLEDFKFCVLMKANERQQQEV